MDETRTLKLMVVLMGALIVASGALVMADRAIPIDMGNAGASGVSPTVTREGHATIVPKGDITVQMEGRNRALLKCGVIKTERSAVEGTAVFESPPPEACTIAIDGRKPYGPVYGGDDLECFPVEDMTECLGGIAAKLKAKVSIESDLGGDFFMGGDYYGALPLYDLRVKPGERWIRVEINDGLVYEYKLYVHPDETVHLHFPAPDGYTAPPASSGEEEVRSDG